MKLFLILQNPHQILLHPEVNFAVAVEGAGTFGVAGEGRDKVGVFDLPIDIPREGAGARWLLAISFSGCLTSLRVTGSSSVTRRVMPTIAGQCYWPDCRKPLHHNSWKGLARQV